MNISNRFVRAVHRYWPSVRRYPYRWIVGVLTTIAVVVGLPFGYLMMLLDNNIDGWQGFALQASLLCGMVALIQWMVPFFFNHIEKALDVPPNSNKE